VFKVLTACLLLQQVVSAGVTDVIEETLLQHGKYISSAHWHKQYPVCDLQLIVIRQLRWSNLAELYVFSTALQQFVVSC
jgi:hypothetical protein